MILNDMHLLEQFSGSGALFPIHQDRHEPGLTVSITVCIYVSGGATGFFMVGRGEPQFYEEVGDAVAFESHAWHASVPPEPSAVSYRGAKITFFFSGGLQSRST